MSEHERMLSYGIHSRKEVLHLIRQAKFEFSQLTSAFSFGNDSSFILASRVPCEPVLELMRGSMY